MTRLAHLHTDLDFLTDHWTDLTHARLKGTPRPWTEPAMTPDARAQADLQARQERHDRAAIAPGEHPAPVHIDILDVIVSLVATADTAAERTAQAAGVDAPGPASSAFADPGPHLRFIRAWWTQADEAAPDIARVVAQDLAAVADQVRAALGMVRDGQTLKACCPFCGGRAPHKPTGGAHTLRVHDTADGPLVVCHGDGCEPPEADCGVRWRGRPAWHDSDWAWLAQRIDAAGRESA